MTSLVGNQIGLVGFVSWFVMTPSTVWQLTILRNLMACLAFPGSLKMHPLGRIRWHRNKQTKTPLH